MKNGHRLLTEADVEAWLADPANGGVTKLRSMLNRGEITGAYARNVSDFIARKDAFNAGLLEVKRLELEMRAVKASERSARWAGVAIVISLAALAVSAIPLIRGQ